MCRSNERHKRMDGEGLLKYSTLGIAALVFRIAVMLWIFFFLKELSLTLVAMKKITGEHTY